MTVADPTGVGPDYLVPGTYLEVLFNQGAATAAVGAREVVLAMPKLSGSGTWTANVVYEIRSEQDAINGAGAGSPLHRAARAFLRSQRTTRLWALPVAPTTGGSPVAATVTVTVANSSTAAGVATITICGEDCSFSFASGATADSIATGLRAAINAKTHLPVAATGSTGSVVITAKVAGTAQNGLNVRSSITSGVTTTLSGAAALSSGAEGTTTEAAQLATALASIDGRRLYYIGISSPASAAIDNLITHLKAKSLPAPGLRSVGVAASRDTLANTQTIAVGDNYERVQLVWQRNSEHDPAEMVGMDLAARALHENQDPAFNFNGFRGSSAVAWNWLPQFTVSEWPDATDLNDALQDGITPIASDATGAYLVQSCTTRSKNAAGTVDDWRSRETHRVSVADRFGDELAATFALRYASQKFKGDDLLPDGTVNPNARRIRNVVTPSQLAAFIKELLEDFDARGLIQSLDASKASVQVEKNRANSGRASAALNLHVIDLLNQFAPVIYEVSV